MASGNREAKVTFKAETSAFDSQLKQSASQMRELRSAVRLADTTMRTAGTSVEQLRAKQQALRGQLQANRAQQEALTGKIEAATRIYGADSQEVARLRTQLNNARSAEQSIQSQLAQTNAALQEQEAAAKKDESAFGRLESSIDRNEAELAQLKQAYKEVVVASGQESDEARELEGKIRTLNSTLQEDKAKMAAAEQAAESLTRAEKDVGDGAEGAVSGIDSMKVALGNLIADGVQAALQKAKDLAGQVVEIGSNFTSSMSKVQALSGSTQEQMAQLEGKARELGATTTFSAADVADAFGYMSLAGWGTSDMLDGVNGVLKLAQAGEMDLANASDIVTDYLTAFGLSAADSDKFVDQLAYTMANSNTNVEQLGEAYKSCASTAHSMGFSVEDTTAALATMANAGVKGGEAGTALSAIMTRMATNSSNCGDKLADLGVNVYDSQGNMRDLSSILEDLSGVWGDLGDEEQAALAKTIAGTNHYSKLQTIMAGLGDEAKESGTSFGDYKQALENCEGTAQQMSDVMTDNLAGDMAGLNSAAEELGLKIYDGIEQPMRSATQFVTSGVIPALTWVWQNLPSIATLLGGIAVAIGVCNAALIASKVQMLAQAAATGIATAAQWLWNTALAANPIGIVIIAVAALAAGLIYLYNNNETVRNALIGAWNAIQSVLGPIFEGIAQAASAAFDFIKTAIGNAITVARATVMVAVMAIRDFLAFTGIGNAVSSAFNAVRSFISTAVGLARSAVSTAVNAIKGFLKFSGVTAAVSGVFNAVKNLVNTAIAAAQAVVSGKVSSIKDLLRFPGLSGAVQGVFNAVKGAITGPIEAAKGIVSNAMGHIKSIISGTHLSLPHINLPHFSVSGGVPPFGLGGKGSMPSMSVSWYANGAVFDRPTLFATPFGYKGVGEAGPETVSPVSVLQRYIADAVQSTAIVQALREYTSETRALREALPDILAEALPDSWYPGDRAFARTVRRVV